MKHSKSGLFLMELIISLLFFALASTVCIRLFVKSATLSQDTLDLTKGVSLAQNLAECFISCDGDMAQMQLLFPDSKTLEENVLIIEEDDLIAALSISPRNEDGIISGNIIISNPSGEEIYALNVQHYIPERGTSHE